MKGISSVCTVLKFTSFISSAILLLMTSGCAMNAAHHMAIKDARNFSKAYSELDPVAPGHGRVIIYWEKRPMLAAMGSFRLHGDAGHLSLAFASQTGTVIDLPEGSYTLSSGGKLNKSEVVFTVHEGASACYNTETIYDFMFGTRSGAMTPVPMEACLPQIIEQDIRCNLTSCQVMTVIPPKEALAAPYSTTDNHKQLELLSKEFTTPADRSRIYITRRKYTLGMFKYGVDGKPTTTMESSSYACYDVEPGFHVITSDEPIGEMGFPINTRGGENYFFHSDALGFLPADKGEEQVRDYDLIRQGFYRSAMQVE
jgi:hypothetical protein